MTSAVATLFDTAQLALEKAAPVTVAECKAIPPVGLHGQDSNARQGLETFISRRFAQTYGATIGHFLPILFAVIDRDSISAALGIRSAEHDPLFIEQYLDEPIESALLRICARPVSRYRIVEIGNLASSGRTDFQFLFVMLTSVLHQAGFQWVVFTATDQLRTFLRRLNFVPLDLCEANPGKLRGDAASWGSYYDSKPLVHAGNIDAALDGLRRNRYANNLLLQSERLTSELAAQLRARRANHAG